MINCIIFDMDGTILDTLKDIQVSINYAFKLKNLKEQSLLQVRAGVGNGARVLIDRLVPENTSIEEKNEIFHLYQNYYDKHHDVFTGPYEGILELLDELKKLGYKLAVVSNKFEHLVQELNVKIFKGYFDIAIGETKGVPIKPAPDMLYRAFKFLNVKASEVIFVGDSDTDIMTAKNADLISVGVTWGFRDEAVLVSNGADYIISKPEQLLNIVKEINKI